MLKAYNLGVKQCILKPFDELELVACTKAVLRENTGIKTCICDIADAKSRGIK
jgi:DNA-binding response OmpR family regulator